MRLVACSERVKRKCWNAGGIVRNYQPPDCPSSSRRAGLACSFVSPLIRSLSLPVCCWLSASRPPSRPSHGSGSGGFEFVVCFCWSASRTSGGSVHRRRGQTRRSHPRARWPTPAPVFAAGRFRTVLRAIADRTRPNSGTLPPALRGSVPTDPHPL